MNENVRDIQLTEFDYHFADPHLQIIKAAIPYLPVDKQHVLSMLIKVHETRRAMELISTGDMTAMGLHPDTPQPSSPFEVLQAIKPYANPRERDMIDMLENFQLMIQAMQTTLS